MKIVLTGGAGFIGSCLLWKLNAMGISNIIVVDELGKSDKWKNLVGKQFEDYIEKDVFLELIKTHTFSPSLDCLIHLGACSATTEPNASYLIENNYQYSKELGVWADRHKIRFLYASSAATYGDGTQGYSDLDEVTPSYRPLNMYGYSKHLFDLWVIRHSFQKQFAGFKFFNVFGPNEYHKGDMQSKVFKGYHEIRDTGSLKLFKSYHPDYKDGEQKRDFVYIKDIVDILWFFITHPDRTGIYNLGTGHAHSWKELAVALFRAMGKQENISFIDMPDILKSKYQYFTQADIRKLREVGYSAPFMSLENAVKDYVSILESSYYL